MHFHVAFGYQTSVLAEEQGVKAHAPGSMAGRDGAVGVSQLPVAVRQAPVMDIKGCGRPYVYDILGPRFPPLKIKRLALWMTLCLGYPTPICLKSANMICMNEGGQRSSNSKPLCQ